jgi:hypothetical protein
MPSKGWEGTVMRDDDLTTEAWTELLPPDTLDAYNDMDDAALERIGREAWRMARDLGGEHGTARMSERYAWAFLLAHVVRRMREMSEFCAQNQTRQAPRRRSQ